MFARRIRLFTKVAGVLAIAIAVSGCIIVPPHGPRYGYYHPHPYGYY
jgi:hypothetical protein